MKKLFLSILVTSVFCGCAFLPDESNVVQKVETSPSKLDKESESSWINKKETIFSAVDAASHKKRGGSEHVWIAANPSINKTNKNITHYTRGLMQELVSNLQYVNTGTPVAVADFVMLDSNYETSNLLGMQLAEAFSHEVHKLGVPVVDYKLTDYVRVTTDGSIALSKDYLELSADIPIRYVLTGTLMDQGADIIVNARIVGLESKAIVASAQGVIPKNAVSNFYVQKSNDGIF